MAKYLIIFFVSYAVLKLADSTDQHSFEKAQISPIKTNNDSSTKAKNQVSIHQAGDEKLIKIYTQAISDYISAVSKQRLIHLDTLYFLNRKNGQPDDFPDIILPQVINKCQIRLIEPNINKKVQEENKSRVLINLIGWVYTGKAEFIFVTFSNGFKHQFDCTINYNYDPNKKEFVLVKSRIELVNKK